jgi:hypothetical protein
MKKNTVSELILELGVLIPSGYTWTEKLRDAFDYIHKETQKKYVFVSGYGLLLFKVKKEEVHFDRVQYKGLIKLPKGVFTSTGGKWYSHDFWYNEEDIFDSIEDAIRSIIKSHP